MSPRRRLNLERAAARLYADPRPEPLLGQLLAASGELVGALAGSVSIISGDGRRYVKLAERGASCRLGQSFPADEGATGQVVARRRPVVLDSYDQIPRGHLDRGHAATAGAVAALPIWWGGRLIGAHVVFAGTQRRFTVAEIDDLERLTQLAAAGLATVDGDHPTLSELIRYRAAATGSEPGTGNPAGADAVGIDTVVTEVGRARRVSPSVAQVALDLVGLAEQAAVARPGAAELHVAVVHRPTGLRLLVHDAHGAAVPGAAAGPPADAAAWQELVDTIGGGVSVDHVPGWGTLLRADLQYAESGDATGAAPGPFTTREQQVLELLAEGAGDKMIARRLRISQRTVEKHVGAVLRKTGSPSRTAAVVRALDRRWLAAPGSSAGNLGPADD